MLEWCEDGSVGALGRWRASLVCRCTPCKSATKTAIHAQCGLLPALQRPHCTASEGVGVRVRVLSTQGVHACTCVFVCVCMPALADTDEEP